MKLIRNSGNQWQYALKQNEVEVLRVLLKGFPFTKPALVHMSKGRHDAEALDRELLLNESLAAHRSELKSDVEKLMDCLSKETDGWALTLKTDSKEALLQILNDIRIGAWKNLGEPEDIHQPPASPEKIQLWNLMNLAGYFEENLVNPA